MSLFKKVLSLAIILINLLGVTGCMTEKSPEATKAEIENYLKDKYHESFAVHSMQSANWAYAGDIFTAYAKSRPDTYFTVKASAPGDKYKYVDGYYEVFIQEDYQKYILKLINNLGVPRARAFLLLGDATCGSKLTKEIPCDKIYETDKSESFEFVVLTTSKKDAELLENKFPEVMVKNEIYGSVSFYAVSEEMYNKIVDYDDYDNRNSKEFDESVIYNPKTIMTNSDLQFIN